MFQIKKQRNSNNKSVKDLFNDMRTELKNAKFYKNKERHAQTYLDNTRKSTHNIEELENEYFEIKKAYNSKKRPVGGVSIKKPLRPNTNIFQQRKFSIRMQKGRNSMRGSLTQNLE